MDPASARRKFRAALTEVAQLDKSDFDLALRQILKTDAELLEVGRVSYWELAPDHSSIRCRLLFRRDAGVYEEGVELREADFPAYFEAMLESRTIVAHDAWTDPRTSEFVEAYFKPNGIRSMLDVPVWRCGKLAGVLCHEHLGTVRTWPSDQQDFATGIGNMISVALEAGDRRRAEESYALVARATNDVLWDWDLKRNVVEWNEGISSVFRFQPEVVAPTADWWLDQVHPEDRARVTAKFTSILTGTGSSWTDQYRFIRGDGTIATVMDRGIVVRDERGAAVRMVGSMLDVSERVAMQARLALSDRMASIGTLAAGVAHEINNPLTYIKANLACALEEIQRGCSARDIAELLREAQEGAERVRRIVRDLKTFSRPNEDDGENLDVNAVIESSINMAWNEIRHRAQLVKIYGDTPQVRMNRARLGQVILNVLVNAAQAIEEGEVDRNQIHVRTMTSASGEVLIEIRDTGCGIPENARPRIFEPFFTTKPIGVGTGLGLSICHTIVSAAGGRIDVAPGSGGGTIVRVVLPAAVAPAVATTRPPGAGRRRRILLVDDEAGIRRALLRMLEPQHEVALAESGEHALERVRTDGRYDVIICDLMMPHMSGMELFERLLVEAKPLARRMIFMTGGAFSHRSREFLEVCACPLIEKPFNRESVAQAIAALA